MITKKEIMSYLESLVMKRVTEEQLNKKLSDYFGEPIEVYNASQGRIDNGEDSDELADYNFMFSVTHKDNYCDVDIYMLPTREVDNDKTMWYITEVGYEFS